MPERVVIQVGALHSPQPAHAVYASPEIRRKLHRAQRKKSHPGKISKHLQSGRHRRERSIRNPESASSVGIVHAPIGTMLDRGVMSDRHARCMHDAVAGAYQAIAEVHALMPQKKFGWVAADRQ